MTPAPPNSWQEQNAINFIRWLRTLNAEPKPIRPVGGTK